MALPPANVRFFSVNKKKTERKTRKPGRKKKKRRACQNVLYFDIPSSSPSKRGIYYRYLLAVSQRFVVVQAMSTVWSPVWMRKSPFSRIQWPS